MHLIDSHCHLDFEQFDTDRQLVLEHCEQLGVKQIILPGVTASSWGHLLDICQQSAMLYPALGLHPMFMSEYQAEHLTQLKDYIEAHQIVAIGEIGLDFYLPEHDKTSQIELFTQQLKIAQQVQLPVILHVRKAHDDVINLLKRYPVKGGVVHAFSGSLQQATRYQQLGFLFGIGGACTHQHAIRLHKLIRGLPLSSLVLETDAPDMPLANMQTHRNTPENIPRILTTIANLRAESPEDIAAITTTNCKNLFNI